MDELHWENFIMDNTKKLGLIIGSLRKDSINRMVAEYIVSQLPENIEVEEIEIAQLPLYNQDYDKQTIESYDQVRQKIKEVDTVLIVTPEHNRTLPAALKNVIDIASRPHGDSAWSGKKVAVVTASPGTYGGRQCGLDVRKSMQALSAKVMIAPEVYLSHASDSIEDGKVSNEKTQQYLTKFADALVQFIEE